MDGGRGPDYQSVHRGMAMNVTVISHSWTGNYAFISISGGASGPNPKLAGELQKRCSK
jgi:hypothetical protein